MTAILPAWIEQPPPAPPDWPEPDWERFREVCRAHGVAPLLHRRLAAPAWRESAAGLWLAAQAAANARRIARIQGELAAVLAAFAGLPLLPLKGCLLTAFYYDECALRPMADLDFLLPDESFAEAEARLAPLGYRLEHRGWKHFRFGRPGDADFVDEECEHPDNPRRLEVHPYCREKILDDVVDLTAILRQSARPARWRGLPVWILSPEALWLHLLLHATHHLLVNDFRLLHLLDLARVLPWVRQPQDWLDRVEARAVYPPLALLRRTFPNAVPGSWLEPLRRRLPAGFLAWAEGLNLFESSYLHPAPWRDA